MSDISLIDTNFKVETKLDIQNIRFYNARNFPFQIHGVFYEGGVFRRMPAQIAKSVSEGVDTLHVHTAGGRVRFKTDSPYVAIHAKMPAIGKMPHFALTGSAGFDIYADDHYVNTFVPPFDLENFVDGYESVVRFQSTKMREITINFPLYSSVAELFIGIQEESALDAPRPYGRELPIVFYGSSITQGGCASRPGMSYQSIVSRRMDADFINLGFSGNAKGEDEIADYISNLEMSCFVYDYDHNAPTPEHLANTHEKMFLKVRQNHPKIPIVMMSRPKYHLTEEEEKRLQVIRTTYENAVSRGDENVYLLDGRQLMELAGDEGTVDNCHPNDLGFASIAKCVGDLLEEVIYE